MKRIISPLLIFSVLASAFVVSPKQINAASLKINKKSATLYASDTLSLKVKGATQVLWKSSKPSVASVSETGLVTAISSGKATVSAKVGKKKLNCKVTVKVKYGSGTKKAPKNAYNKNTFTYYEEGKKKGKFQVKLLSFITGDKATKMAMKNSANQIPTNTQEYIYFKFRIKYLSGDQTISAKDLFNYYYNIYGAKSTRQLNNISWGFFFEAVDDLGQVELSPGNNVVCSKAILVDKGYAPITYRIQTGKNSYTWFTTAK